MKENGTGNNGVPRARQLSSPDSILDMSRDCTKRVTLGMKGHAPYKTRFAVNRKEQRAKVWEEVLFETVCPCVPKEKNPSCGRRVWNFISCEPFLLTLHLSAIMLGVLKATIHNKDVDENLHIAESCMETVVAVAQIIIRMVLGRERYHEVKEHREHAETINDEVSAGVGVKRWLYAFLVLGGILLAFTVGCCVAFYFIRHMEWTILSNNFALVVATVSSNLLMDRITNMIFLIREDQHKAVIYEALMLLVEYGWTDSPEHKEKIRQRINKFSKALHETTVFDKPEYMDCEEKFRPRWDMVTTMQLQTSI